MENNLGINDNNSLKDIEYKITNLKYKMIDENFTFNEETIFSINYLEKIHIFLFGDIYPDKYCKIRKEVSHNTRERINKILEKMNLLYQDFNSKVFSDLLYKIWQEQIFYDGNTRTLLSFVKVYSIGFGIDFDYDFNKDINEDFFIDKIIDSIEKSGNNNYSKLN